MKNITNEAFAKIAFEMLCDDNGVPYRVYSQMEDYLPDEIKDIVDGTDDTMYIPEKNARAYRKFQRA